MQYDPKEIDAKWQQEWRNRQTYRVETDPSKPKYYVLDMFPYPSGAGLHVGHPLGYIASDIFARYKRQCGFNVLHPMGYDAFGLPAEQYAIDTGIHPAVSTEENIKRYRAQLDNIGFSFDWSREVRTCDPAYYKWTQQIFLWLFESYYCNARQSAQPISELIEAFETRGNGETNAPTTQETIFTAEEWKAMTPAEKDDVLMNYRLAFRKQGSVNWCEALGTVLANDEVKDGVSERGGHPVEIRPMMQWTLRITAYAQRLLDGLDTVDFPEALKVQQRNWIGRSEGARLFFDVAGTDARIEIFTTRPDTIHGATFMVLAPEHEMAAQLTTEAQRAAVDEYLTYVKSRSERERMTETRKVTGVFTGAYATNPFTGQPIPVWLSEYVLAGYGTGAIMAVPGHDERDNRFANHFGLPVIQVVQQPEGTGIEEKSGKMINSGILDGLEVKDAIVKILGEIESRGIGSRQVNFRLRDANFSRQRYWGEPFPIVYDDNGVAYPDFNLPLELPHIDDYKGAGGGKSPLAKADEWVNTADGKTRETDTMPGYAGSSWYFLRYMDPTNESEPFSAEAVNYWQDVDLYIGGSEHAVGHLLYSRFWHKFLYDLKKVPTQEPYKKLINQGMIQGVAEYIYLMKEKQDGRYVFVSADLAGEYDADSLAKLPVHIDFVADYGTQEPHLDKAGIEKFCAWRSEYQGAEFIFNASGKFKTESEVGKMSKRLYNVVNPDDVVAEYGSDCFRLYEMFLGPLEMSKPWDTKSIRGTYRFLQGFWDLFHDKNGWALSDDEPTKDELRALHTAIKKVREDIERFSFNTCVSSFMILTNELRRLECHKRAVLEPAVILIAPFAPHIAEELWEKLGHADSVTTATYPVHNDAYLEVDEIEYPICVNGKLRTTMTFAKSTPNSEIEATALASEVIQRWLEGKPAKKVIVVPGKMVNVVV